MSILAVILFVSALPAALLAFSILDRLHQRKAWREAIRHAEEILGREHRQ